MVRVVDKDTKISDVLNEYPFVEDMLINYHGAFKKLKNTFVRNTVGKVATINMAASMAGVDAEELVSAIRREIAKRGMGDGASGVGAPAMGRRASREVLKDILMDLHKGGSREEIQARFNVFASGMDASDIAAVEQELVDEGLPESEIRGLCDFHARLVGAAVHGPGDMLRPGHPAHTLVQENRELERRAGELEVILGDLPESGTIPDSVVERLGGLVRELLRLEIHYQRKENQFFPYLEKHGITAPPQVMWAVHDDIRAMMKRASQALVSRDASAFRTAAGGWLHNFREMVFKEEKIFVPLCLETFDDQEWFEILKGEPDIGYVFAAPGTEWKPVGASREAVSDGSKPGTNQLRLETGELLLPQINMMLKTLPFDVTYVDEDDRVRYFTDTQHRVFPRSPAIIGRAVQNCHPPKSLDIVNEILTSFRTGAQREAEFWLEAGGRFIHIRYFAMHDPLGKYRGCLEVSQDITEIRMLKGERRLLQWAH